jgi:hypothetical protein
LNQEKKKPKKPPVLRAESFTQACPMPRSSEVKKLEPICLQIHRTLKSHQVTCTSRKPLLPKQTKGKRQISTKKAQKKLLTYKTLQNDMKDPEH